MWQQLITAAAAGSRSGLRCGSSKQGEGFTEFSLSRLIHIAAKPWVGSLTAIATAANGLTVIRQHRSIGLSCNAGSVVGVVGKLGGG